MAWAGRRRLRVTRIAARRSSVAGARVKAIAGFLTGTDAGRRE
jgi:hypothetical protein